MIRSLFVAACLCLAIALGGCQFLSGLPFITGEPVRHYAAHVSPQGQSVKYLGDTLGFTINQRPTRPTTVNIEFTHMNSQASRSFQPAFSDLETFTLPLAADELPGFSEDELNRYRLWITLTDTSGNQQGISSEFFVVSDRSIQPIPRGRENSTSRVPTYAKAAGTVEGLEALAMEIATHDWKGQGVTMTRRQRSREEAPSWLEERDERDDIDAWEFVAVGEYLRYAVPAEFNLLGRDAVMKPTRLRISLSRTEPIIVLAVWAEEVPLEPAQP